MIIIPAAGEGRRFREAGYTGPKHLIPLAGKSMIERVVDNVRPLDPHGEVFVAIQALVGKTAGAMETLQRAFVQAKPKYDEPLVIANCDQLVDYDADWVRASTHGHGFLFTFKSANPAHSYVATGRDGRIQDIIEKPRDPAGQGWNQAVSGVYYFTNPHPIQTAIKDCLAVVSPSASGPEQYLSLAIGAMIRQNYHLYAVDAPTAILGTPEDFQRFETAYGLARSLS